MSPALLLTLALAAPPSLQEGIRLYEGEDYSGALVALTQALDRATTDATRARIRVYIGLIQYRFDQRRDARLSFDEALQLDAKASLPSGSPRGARRLFRKIKRKYKPKPRRRSRVRRRPPADDEPDDPPPAAAPPPPRAVAPPPPPPPPPEAVAAPSEPLTATTPPPDDGANVPAWVVASVGAAAVITGAVLVGVSAGTEADADAEPVAARAQSLYDDAVAQRAGGLATLGVGAALGGLAAYLFLVD